MAAVQTLDGPVAAPAEQGEAPPEGKRLRLSEELEDVLRLASGERIPVRALVEHLSGRGNALLAFFLVLPFLQPVPLPGVSTPFGIAVVLLGTAMALGKPLWLPRRWLDHELRSAHVVRIAGVVIAVSGAELALPLPIAFTNTLPALAIVATAIGLLEEDALLAVVGEALFLVSLAVFGSILALPVVGWHLIF